MCVRVGESVEVAENGGAASASAAVMGVGSGSGSSASRVSALLAAAAVSEAGDDAVLCQPAANVDEDEGGGNVGGGGGDVVGGTDGDRKCVVSLANVVDVAVSTPPSASPCVALTNVASLSAVAATSSKTRLAT